MGFTTTARADGLTEIACILCERTYTYEDDGVSVDCMPDGYILPQGWVCDDCGSCKECGRTLEKEPQKRGPEGSRVCRYCEEAPQ